MVVVRSFWSQVYNTLENKYNISFLGLKIFAFPYNSSLIQRAPYFTEAHFPYFTLQQIIMHKWAHYRHNTVEKLSTADQDWLVSDDCSRLVGEVG